MSELPQAKIADVEDTRAVLANSAGRLLGTIFGAVFSAMGIAMLCLIFFAAWQEQSIGLALVAAPVAFLSYAAAHVTWFFTRLKIKKGETLYRITGSVVTAHEHNPHSGTRHGFQIVDGFLLLGKLGLTMPENQTIVGEGKVIAFPFYVRFFAPANKGFLLVRWSPLIRK